MTTTETWTIGRLLTWTADYLKKAGSQSPRLDAEVLLAHARGCQRIELYTAFSEEPSEQTRATFRDLVRRRAEGAPVAYLVGYKEFYSMTFEVNANVLVPRPETEHLVVEAIDLAKLLLKELTPNENASLPTGHPNDLTSEPVSDAPNTEQSVEQSTDSDGDDVSSETRETLPDDRDSPPAIESPEVDHSVRLQMADVGTGSGAVAIAILKHFPRSYVTAVDISPAALEVAKRNAQRHAMDDERICFVEGDLLSWCPDDQLFDLIVSNPPYVSPEEFEELPKSVRDFEPRAALIAEPNGGSVIARLVSQASGHIRPGGYLIFEFSPMLESRLIELISPPHAWSEPTITKDISGNSRVVTLKRLESSLP